MPASHVPITAREPAASPAPAASASYATELATLLGPAGGGDGAEATGWADALAFKAGAPRLVVARYDALRALRADPAAAPLRIVAPLALDEVLFVVRADVAVPLTFIHEIAGHRIDAGPATSARALTAATVHERLFGTRPAAWANPAPGEDAALQRLAASDGADVVVVVGAQALDAFAAAHPDTMRRLKLLGLDRQHASSTKVLQSYLPLTLRAAEHRAWLAQDTLALASMAFVVTSASADADDPEFIDRFARALCDRLPQLQRGGDPKWRAVAPQVQLPAGWPYSTAAARAFAVCAAPTVHLSKAPQPEGVRP